MIATKSGTSIYLLNTSKGLLPHTEVIQYKIGGNFIGIVN
jgi:ribosomal protein S8